MKTSPLITLASLVLLASCGGGGGEDASDQFTGPINPPSGLSKSQVVGTWRMITTGSTQESYVCIESGGDTNEVMAYDPVDTGSMIFLSIDGSKLRGEGVELSLVSGYLSGTVNEDGVVRSISGTRVNAFHIPTGEWNLTFDGELAYMSGDYDMQGEEGQAILRAMPIAGGESARGVFDATYDSWRASFPRLYGNYDDIHVEVGLEQDGSLNGTWKMQDPSHEGLMLNGTITGSTETSEIVASCQPVLEGNWHFEIDRHGADSIDLGVHELRQDDCLVDFGFTASTLNGSRCTFVIEGNAFEGQFSGESPSKNFVGGGKYDGDDATLYARYTEEEACADVETGAWTFEFAPADGSPSHVFTSSNLTQDDCTVKLRYNHHSFTIVLEGAVDAHGEWSATLDKDAAGSALTADAGELTGRFTDDSFTGTGSMDFGDGLVSGTWSGSREGETGGACQQVWTGEWTFEFIPNLSCNSGLMLDYADVEQDDCKVTVEHLDSQGIRDALIGYMDSEGRFNGESVRTTSTNFSVTGSIRGTFDDASFGGVGTLWIQGCETTGIWVGQRH